MMRTPTVRLVSTLLLAIFLAAEIAPLAPPPAAHAQAGPVNAIVGLARLIGSFRSRNRVYREARTTQGEMNAYYDALQHTAQQQLLDRQLAGTGQLSTENRTQTRVYIKLDAAMRAEKAAVTQQIEAEKNQARQAFNRRLGNQVAGILVNSPGGQKLIGELRQTVGEVRQAAQAVQAAAAAGRPFDALTQALVNKVDHIPQLQGVAHELGQAAGQQLDHLLGGMLTKVDQAMVNVQGGMGDALTEIDKIDTELARFDQRQRTPVSLVEDDSPLGGIHGVDRANAAVDVASQALTNAAIIAGALRDDSQKETMRQRIRSQLLAQRIDRLAQARNKLTHVVCDAAGRDDYLEAVNKLGTAPELPLDPSTATYLICRDAESGDIIHASLIGGAVAQGAPSEEVAEASETPVTPVAVAPGEERCDLTGEGDFVIENLSVSSASSTCEDTDYPFGLPAEPFLLVLATAGKWTVVSETADSKIWGFQPTQDLQGGTVDGTATLTGGTLDIDVTMSVPRAGSRLDPVPGHDNGWALLALLPVFPLSLVLTSRRKRRLLVLAAALAGLLLAAQTCEVYGTLSGHYSFPIPENGFPCQVAPDNPNLAEMPGATGQVQMQISIADEDGVETCSINGSVSGLGVLKQDGFYTQDSLSQ